MILEKFLEREIELILLGQRQRRGRSGMDLNGSGVHGRSIGTIYLGTGHGRPVRMNGGPSPLLPGRLQKLL